MILAAVCGVTGLRPIDFGGSGPARLSPIGTWIDVRRRSTSTGRCGYDTLLGGDGRDGHLRLDADPHLQRRLHGARSDAALRFFAYLSLFTFAMLMLVTADNFLQLFFGWEGVGLACYLLIGYWYDRPSANAAAIKAFIVNRVGDFGFALGIALIFLMFGSIEFDDHLRRGRRQHMTDTLPRARRRPGAPTR